MLIKWAVCISVLTSCGICANAQFADSGSGFVPYQTYDLTQIGAVNLYSGRLTVDIPLLDYKQVGKLPDLKIDLVMNSLSWIQAPYAQNTCSGCTIWTPVLQYNDDGTYSQASLGKLSYHVGAQYSSGFYTGPPDSNGFYPTYGYAQDYTAARHFFGNTETIDATGIMTSGGGIIDKNGVSYRADCSQTDQNNFCIQYERNVSDPNQNVVTWNFPSGGSMSATSITDSVGRSIPILALDQVSAGCYPIGFPGPQGSTGSTIQICTSDHQVSTNFQPGPGVTQYSGPISLVDSVQLPTGQQFTFQYNASGDLTQINLPTGGSIGFTWNTVYGSQSSNGNNFLTAFQSVASRTLSSGTATGTWTYTPNNLSGNPTLVVVHDPNQNDTAHNFDLNGYEYETDYFNGSYTAPSGGGSCSSNPSAPNLIKSELTCYTGTISRLYFQIGFGEIPAQKTTLWHNGQQSTVSYQYDMSQTAEDQNYELSTGTSGAYYQYTTGSMLSSSTYDYGSGSAGPLLQQEIINYKWQADSNYLNANLLSIPTSDFLQDGAQNRVSETDYSYDEATYGPSGTHGNLTTTSQYLNTGSALQSHTYFNTQGMPTKETDPGGNSTTITYQCGVGAFPLAVTNALNLQTTYGYDCNSGLPTSLTDANTQTTSYTYDASGNPTSVNFPDGGQTIAVYTATQTSQFRFQNAGTTTDTETLVDGLGRLNRTAIGNGQSGNPWYQQDSCYNVAGQITFRSYQYQGAGWGVAPVCSGNGDSYSYVDASGHTDALGRVWRVTHADGTSVNYAYAGRATQITDEHGVSRISQVDGLGRTTAVCEISSDSTMPNSGSPSGCGLDIAGTGFLTTYAYDLANHKTTIAQGAQSRVFQTDSVGRPVLTQEPEAGQTAYSYSYNSYGLLVTRQRPEPNQTNTGVLVSTGFQYDPIGRLIKISYSDGTPETYFYYDQATAWGNSNFSLGASKGRLTEVARFALSNWTGGVFAYDAMGRITTSVQCFPSGCGNGALNSWNNYSYDWLGNILSATDGSGTTTSYTYSRANEVLSVSSSLNDSTDPGSLVTSVQNGPNGPLSWQLGNGLTGVASYDTLGRRSGGWVCSNSSAPYCSGGTQVYGFTAGWTGPYLTSACDTALGQCNSYGYDDFGRLKSLIVNSGRSGNYTWVYDRWGNRVQQNPNGPSLTMNTSTNRANELSYDAAGNVLSDGVNNYAYDPDGNMTHMNGTVFTYNGLNQRVRIDQSGGGVQEFAFNLNGQRSSIWDGSTHAQIQGQTYWGALPLAHYTGGQTYFQHHDWLGTERMTTAYNGSVAGTYISLPFGDGYSASGSDTDVYHFAGLDQDYTTTGHAQFRQYANLTGRWLSPDVYSGSYDFSNPQSLNRYSYALNNPLQLKDPTGLYCFYGDPDNENDNFDPSQFDFHSSQKECTAPDENGNAGQWINDGATHYTADGYVDNANRPDAYVFQSNVNSAPSTDLIQTGVSDFVSVLTTAGGAAADLFLYPTNFVNSMTGAQQIPYFRFFANHYCGPGGAGTPNGGLDPACQAHDNCYGAAGLSAASNGAGVSLTLDQAAAAKGCNQALYDAARGNPNVLNGSAPLRQWLTAGDLLPRGWGHLAPGTEARPW